MPASAPALPTALMAQLRPLVAEDAEAWSAYLSLPGAIEHTSWSDISVGGLQQQIAHYGLDQGALRWAIVDPHGCLLGTIGLNGIEVAHARAELAYDIAPAHQGRGLATAVAHATLCWAHHVLGYARVQATVLDSNHASIAVLRKLGMQQEGKLHAYRCVRDVPRDFWMYASVIER
ncbi:MAG: Spermidine N(1)-acetyltransferase [Stenotrophomonas maltophilia]|uniref:Spermidine N(1)-acetyltransferase n=1 Tax=Stenotrophomonas maltophilia TaxID=40324 RepID=A0A7V8JK44_STEMA|nr:MAG: Spermidine N(1)-acetyltransferase [Stenotrophomonas maltophilia]